MYGKMFKLIHIRDVLFISLKTQIMVDKNTSLTEKYTIVKPQKLWINQIEHTATIFKYLYQWNKVLKNVDSNDAVAVTKWWRKIWKKVKKWNCHPEYFNT